MKSEKEQVELIKSIGSEIGYGHLMQLASALWRKSLKEKGYPASGAFIPTVSICIDKEMLQSTIPERQLYDRIVEKYS